MATTIDIGGAMSLAVQGRSTIPICTLLTSCPLLAVLGIMQGNKGNDLVGLGTPSAQNVITGARINNIKMKMFDQINGYSPLERAIQQADNSWNTYRPANVVPSVMGSGAAFTVTTTNGVVTSVAVSNAGSGYTGSPPTLVVVDAAGSSGYGAIAVPTMSAGTFASVSVDPASQGNGGMNYAASGLQIAVQAGNSAGTSYQRPIFQYAENQIMGTLYNRDVDSVVAMLKQSMNIDAGAELSLLQDEIQMQLGNQMKIIHLALWNGVPSDQTANIWSQPAGLLSAIDDANVYGNLDRTTLANYWWKAKKDTSPHVFSLQDLVQDALQTKGLAYQGGEMQGGPDIFIVSPPLFNKFTQQATAQTQVVDLCQGGNLKKVGEYGFQIMAIKYGNVWCIPDLYCPVGTVLGINSKTLALVFKTGKKFTPSKIYDAAGLLAGGWQGSFFYIFTQLMLICEAPALNVKYTNVS